MSNKIKIEQCITANVLFLKHAPQTPALYHSIALLRYVVYACYCTGCCLKKTA